MSSQSNLLSLNMIVRMIVVKASHSVLTGWHWQVLWSYWRPVPHSFSSRQTQPHDFVSHNLEGSCKNPVRYQNASRAWNAFTCAQFSASRIFRHSHLHWFAINFCKLLQSDAVFLHWHRHFLCSFTLTVTSPIACSLFEPVNFVFLMVTCFSDSSVGEHVVPECAQHPPHCFTRMHDGK